MEATTYHGQQRSNGAPALTGASGEKTDTLSRAERWDPHNPHNEGARGGEGVEEIPCHPTEVQPSRRRRKAKEVADPEDAMPTRKRRRGRKSGDPTNQVSFLVRIPGLECNVSCYRFRLFLPLLAARANSRYRNPRTHQGGGKSAGSSNYQSNTDGSD